MQNCISQIVHVLLLPVEEAKLDSTVVPLTMIIHMYMALVASA